VTQSDPQRRQPSLRERKRADTRRAILEAIAEIEMVHGGTIDPSLVTYARIAAIAGVSERTVYRFFPSKADLDRAYAEATPIALGEAMPVIDVESYASAIEAIGRRWTQRLGPLRVAEHELGADDYPESFARRRERDQRLVEMILDEQPALRPLPEPQRRAIAAVINHTLSIRSVAIIAQRWNLTIEEATRAQAWAARVLAAHLATDPPEPWEDE
jgi:AcrR family transcriptional regulator